MKKIEFKTSKGDFVLMDMKHNSWFQNEHLPKGYTTEWFIKLSEITEEQASDILGDMKFHNYGNYIPTPKLKLESLLKSKGIHLYDNPLQLVYQTDTRRVYSLNENNTFYNPYLFKKI